MTGFGRASVEAGERRLRVEIRSVNHRGLDLKIRGARAGRLLRRRDRRAPCAPPSSAARSRCSSATSRRPARRASTRRACARSTRVLERLRQELEIEEPVGLADGRGVHERRAPAAELEGEALWEALRPARRRGAGRAARDARARGRGAGRRPAARTGRGCASWRRDLRQAPPALPERFARRLEERLAALREPARVRAGPPGAGGGADGRAPGRQRGAGPAGDPPRRTSGELLARRRARSAASSTSSSRRSGASSTPSARRRRTPASPALVIDAKAELERMREQAQNVE